MLEPAVRPTSAQDYAVIVLLLSSLALVFASVFLMELLSVNYGVGAGAAVQSVADNANVTASLQTDVLQFSALHQGILETYIVAGVSIAMLLLAFTLFTTRSSKLLISSRRYATIHAILTIFYISLFFIVSGSFDIGASTVYIYGIYAAMAASLCVDAYLVFALTANIRPHKREIGLDPSKPYSNIVAVREHVFSTLSGDVGIVDKHFNSNAMENLHRLLSGVQGIRSVTVVTSKEMLDSGFSRDYTDMKSELKNAGTELGVYVMADADAPSQHERFIFDGNVAYKIPPLSIIHKKSEHVTRTNRADAKRRFDELMGGATKFENYVVKRARDTEGAA